MARATPIASTALIAIGAMFIGHTLHAQQRTTGPMVQVGGARKVSTHVYVISDRGIPGVPNVGIIVGNRATLVVDTGLGNRNGRIVLDEVRRVTDHDPQFLISTHVHPEHDLGANAFPATTKMIRSRDEIYEIKEYGQQTADLFRKRSAVMRKLLESAKFRKADITFDTDYTLDLGDVTVKLFAMGPNHTPGDTAIWVVQDRLLFAGDIAMQALPAFASPKSSLDHWLQSLDRLAALKPKIVVPSHGPIGNDAFIEDYRQYLTLVRSRTAALKAEGKSLEEVSQLVSTELQAAYSASPRMSGAIRVAYREADEAPNH